MDTLNVLFGLITTASFGLALFVYLRDRIRQVTERTKVIAMQERMRGLYQGLITIYHSVDSIVQLPKREHVTIDELQAIARLTRGQTFVYLRAIERYSITLNEWRYGKMIPSDPIAPEAMQHNPPEPADQSAGTTQNT